jgi:hypothetical protein
VQSNPVSIPNTRRQRLVTRSGDELERGYIFLPAASWDALRKLCNDLDCSNSKVIEKLINDANSGKLKGNNGNETIRTN